MAGAVDQWREDSIRYIIEALHGLLLDLRNSCSFACSSMLLGALTKQMDDRALLFPKPAAPFLGFSVAAIAKSILTIITPEGCECRGNSIRRSYHVPNQAPHDCKLDQRLVPLVDALERRANGLTADQSMWTNPLMDGNTVAMSNLDIM